MENILPKNGLPTTYNPSPATPGPTPDRCGLPFAHLEQIRRPSNIVHTKPDWQKDSKQPNAVIYFVTINSLVIRYIETILNCMTAWKIILSESGELGKPTDSSKLEFGRSLVRSRRQTYINTDTLYSVLVRRLKHFVLRSYRPNKTCRAVTPANEAHFPESVWPVLLRLCTALTALKEMRRNKGRRLGKRRGQGAQLFPVWEFWTPIHACISLSLAIKFLFLPACNHYCI